MKKIISLLIIFFLTKTTSAQPQWLASIGPQLSIPVGKFGGVKNGFGFGLELAKGIRRSGAVAASFSFNSFPTKPTLSYPATEHLGFINMRLGYRSSITPGNLYAAADVGLVLFTQDFYHTSGFSYSVGPGYLLKIGNKYFVDLGVKYQYNQRKGDKQDFNWVGFRAAFGLNFGSKKTNH